MTAEELCALPDVDRVDQRLIRGRLVERPHPFRCPAHAATVANLCGILGNWERSPAGAGWVAYGYGCPFRLRRDPDTLLCFDSTVVKVAAVDAASPARAPFIDGLPTLAIEVLDLSDPRHAVAELVDVAVTCGVPLLWLINPFEELVEVHRPGCRSVVLRHGDELDAGVVGPRLCFPVSDLFE